MHDSGDFGVRQAIGAQQQQRGIAPAKPSEHGPYTPAFVLRFSQVFGSGRGRLQGSHDPLVPRASALAPQLVESKSDSRAIQPSGRILLARVGTPPPSDECLDRQFLGAALVTNDAGDDTSDASVEGRKRRIEVGATVLCGRDRDGIGVHIPRTPEEFDL
jgi:hypothetical protein